MVERTSRSRIRTYPCERCGADLAYAPEAGELACAYCGFCVPLDIDEDALVPERNLEGALARLAEQRAEERRRDPETLEIDCPSCHARVVFRGRFTSQSCAYCTSPIQRSDVHLASDRIGVDSILPFALDRTQARKAASAWMKSRWLAPNDFGSKQAPSRIRAVYMPYWTFDALTSSFFRGRIRKDGSRWKRRTGSFRREFDDVTVAADTTLERELARGLEPWPFQHLQPYEPRFIAGHLAKTYQIGLEEGWKRARARMEKALDREVLELLGGDDREIDVRKTRWASLTYRHVLLPVYLLSIRHERSVYRVLVNGATGRVSGHSPVSWVKVVLLGVGVIVTAAFVFTVQALVHWAASLLPGF